MKDETSLELSADMTEIKEGQAPLVGEIQTPGFFNLTICFDPEEAVQNIIAGEKPVCGEKPKGASSVLEKPVIGQVGEVISSAIEDAIRKKQNQG